MQIIGIDHVQLAMPKGGEERARRFYGELLGLEEVEKPEPLRSRGGCWFEAPGVIVHLGAQEEFLPARKAHPAFIVSSLQQLKETLSESDVQFVVDRALPSVERIYAQDPFGNRIEFIQNGDGFSQ